MKYKFPYSQQLISLLAALIVSASLNAQEDRNEIKRLNLEKKVAMAETKIATAELKMTIADSIFNYGDLRLTEAEKEFSRIGAEQKSLDKRYKSEYKKIKKLTKSKDEETAEQAENDLKALERRFNTDVKSYREEIKLLTRQAAKGESDITKGTFKQQDAAIKLKEGQDALELAQENYESFINTLASE